MTNSCRFLDRVQERNTCKINAAYSVSSLLYEEGDLSRTRRTIPFREFGQKPQYAVYKGVIPAGQYRAVTKNARKTNHIELFNNTLRQRVSRLVRETLSFSKTLANHIGAIKYFICHYNLTKAALPL